MFKPYIDLLCSKSERSTHEIQEFISQRDAEYWRWADWFAGGLNRYLAANGMTPEDGVGFYLKEANDILDRTIEFRRTGKYRDCDQKAVFRDHFSKHDKMRQDMVSLALSQFLWPQHYRLFTFFVESIRSVAETMKKYVEIGPGHGLYLATALTLAPQLEQCWGVDISDFSIEMTRQMLSHLGGEAAAKVTLECKDAAEVATGNTFDFLTAGEVLSTSENPRAFLEKMVSLLKPSGKMFLSDCANCPDSSIVYVFHNVQEIRDLLGSCGLVIESERIAPSVGSLSEADHVKHRLSVSYAALMRKA